MKYSLLTVGTHTITVTSYGSDGSTASAVFTVRITAPKPRACIDAPQNNNEYIKDTLTVKGWSVSADGVKSVEVYIDGSPVGKAQTGLVRTDVNAKINANNAYKDAVNSGYLLTLSGLSSCKSGEHTVKIVSTGNNGDIASCESKVSKAAPLIGFDTNGVTVNNSDFTISGYALNAAGVAKVELYYGDIFIGTAATGIASTDIQTKYDKNGLKYKDASKSRFSLNVSINSVPYGTGKITAKATGNDGEVIAVSTDVNVVKPVPLGCIDTPASGQNYTYNDTSMTVSGWTLNASGVKSVGIYLDDQQISDVTTGIASGDASYRQSGRKLSWS